MTLSIIHLFAISSYQIHSSFSFNEISPLIKKRILSNYKLPPQPFVSIKNILPDKDFLLIQNTYIGSVKSVKLPNNVLVVNNQQGMHYFPYYKNNDNNIVLHNCLWDNYPSIQYKKICAKLIVNWLAKYYSIECHFINKHDDFTVFQLAILENTLHKEN
tara:strand:- start:17 stop:493 length:477 start_codon:yes stop_codon:yes gene_type:complete